MKRLQRLRATAALRDMVSEIGFGQSQLIQPLFLAEGLSKEEPLAGLPGNSRHTLTSLLTQFEKGPGRRRAPVPAVPRAGAEVEPQLRRRLRRHGAAADAPARR